MCFIIVRAKWAVYDGATKGGGGTILGYITNMTYYPYVEIAAEVNW